MTPLRFFRVRHFILSINFQFVARSRSAHVSATCLLLAVLAPAAQAQTTNRAGLASGGTNEVGETYLREHYTKFECKIAMRDGVKLFTTVFAPKDDSQPYPLLLTRTPYSLKPYSEDLYPNPNGPM